MVQALSARSGEPVWYFITDQGLITAGNVARKNAGNLRYLRRYNRSRSHNIVLGKYVGERTVGND